MKKTFSLICSAIICLTLCTPVFAYDTFPTKRPILLDSETTLINGVNTLVETYSQNGCIIKSYKFLGGNVSAQEMENSIDTINKEMASQQVNTLASYPTPIASKSFSTVDNRPSDARARASQSGTFLKSNIDYAYLWVDRGQSKASFTDPEYSPEIYVTKTFETTGLAISLSWPPSVSSGSKIYQTTLGPFTGSNFITVDWGPVIATNIAGTGFSITATTEASFYVKPLSRTFTSITSYTQNFQSGW